jgi:hypothetical protein
MPVRISRRLFVAAVLTVVAAGVVWYLQRGSFHPEFGRISESSMAEQPSPWQAAQYFVQRRLGALTAERIWLLRIGSTPLQWSSGGGPRKGFIYANHPLLNNTPLWEFALSPHTRLEEVHSRDLPSDYYRLNDPRGSNVFGTNWSGHAIRVPEGQIFFARVVTNRSTVYVIRLAEQGTGRSRGRMRVEYVTVTNRAGNGSTNPGLEGGPR